MPGGLLTTAAQLTCPHGGMVSAIPSQAKVSLGGATTVHLTDTFVVAGCAFVLGAVPSPCVRVQWQVGSPSGSGGGAATLTTDSVGFCYAATGAIQGSVLIQATQTPVTGN